MSPNRPTTLSVALVLSCLAAVVGVPAAVADPTSGTFAVTNATVHTLTDAGSLDEATVLVVDGRVEAVGRDVSIPADVPRIDAEGRPLTPGLFDTANQIGIVEISAATSTVDAATALEHFGAGFDVAPAFNPHSTLIPVNRFRGLTRSLVVPRSSTGPIAGLGATVHLGGTPDSVVAARAVLSVDLGELGAERAGGSRAAALLRLEETLEDARDLQANAAAFRSGDRYDYVAPRRDLEALAPVLDREVPVLIRVHRASDILAVLRLAERQGIDVVLLGGAEAWRVARHLAEADVPVVLNPLDNLPGSFETLGASLENAARLHAAGVRIAFTAGSSHNASNLSQAAGNAVANGLPWVEGLRAITATPAALWGLAGSVGTIAPGRDADLVLWDGDPLDVTSAADHVWIRGVEMPRETRSTLLRDRYSTVPPPEPPAWID